MGVRSWIDSWGRAVLNQWTHESCCFDVVEALPGAVGVDQFGLVQAHVGLGQGVVVGVADGPDRGVDASVGEAMGEGDRGVLGAGVGVVDQPGPRR
jgi:hypothetical protein